MMNSNGWKWIILGKVHDTRLFRNTAVPEVMERGICPWHAQCQGAGVTPTVGLIKGPAYQAYEAVDGLHRCL